MMNHTYCQQSFVMVFTLLVRYIAKNEYTSFMYALCKEKHELKDKLKKKY